MKKKMILISAFLFLGVFTILVAQPLKEKGTVVDNEALAQKLVNQCASIHGGDFVLINGGAGNLELLEDISINVMKLGAFPLLTIGSDRITRRRYTEVPTKFDTLSPEMDLKLLSFVNAIISVDYNESPDLLVDIPSERLVAINNAYVPANNLAIKRIIRGVSLGNGLTPTAKLAKQYSLTQKELSDIFWNAVNVDYSKLETIGEAVKAILLKGKEIEITNSNGTDLKLRIEGKKVFVSDGITSAADKASGFAGSQVYLPAGEVFLAPISGTAQGKVVIDHYFFQGKEISGIILTIKNGKIASMDAKSGLEPLKAIYDKGNPGKEDFGFIDIGINPNVHLIPGNKFIAWMLSGMVTIGTGNNIWAGGENNNSLSFSYFLPGSTLKVDGKALVENGVLKY
jgi:aminopeptidase